MAETGCKPVTTENWFNGSYRKVLDNQTHFVAKERLGKRWGEMKKDTSLGWQLYHKSCIQYQGRFTPWGIIR